MMEGQAGQSEESFWMSTYITYTRRHIPIRDSIRTAAARRRRLVSRAGESDTTRPTVPCHDGSSSARLWHWKFLTWHGVMHRMYTYTAWEFMYDHGSSIYPLLNMIYPHNRVARIVASSSAGTDLCILAKNVTELSLALVACGQMVG